MKWKAYTRVETRPRAAFKRAGEVNAMQIRKSLDHLELEDAKGHLGRVGLIGVS